MSPDDSLAPAAPPPSASSFHPLRPLLVTLVRNAQAWTADPATWTGVTDAPLSPEGKVQTAALANYFASTPIAAIYSSDLARASEVVDAITAAHKTPVPTVLTATLREQNFGSAEGKAWSLDDAPGAQGQPLAPAGRLAKFPQGESLEEVNARMATAVRRYILPRVESLRNEPPSAHYADSKALRGSHIPRDVVHIVIVSHGIALAELMRVLLSLHDANPPGMASPWPDPRLTYVQAALNHTGWARIEIAVPARMVPGVIPPPPSQEAALDMAAAAAQAAQFKSQGFSLGRSDMNTPSAGRYIFVRVLEQNNTDHLAGLDIPRLGDHPLTTILGGGVPQAPPELGGSSPCPIGYNGLSSLSSRTASSTVWPSHTPGPNGLLGGLDGYSAAANGSNAYDVRSLARELGDASSTIGDGSVVGGDLLGSSYGARASFSPETPSRVTSPSLMHGSLPRGVTPSLPALSSPLASQRGANSAPPPMLGGPSHSGHGSSSWRMVSAKVLALFAGDGTRMILDEVNSHVCLHFRHLAERRPARALETFNAEVTALITEGIGMLNARLTALQGLALLTALAQVWTEYWQQVVPYVEAVFVPLYSELSFARLMASNRANVRRVQGATDVLSEHMQHESWGSDDSPLRPSANPTGPATKIEFNPRHMCLQAFRDEVILPRAEQLMYLFAYMRESSASAAVAVTSGPIRTGRGTSASTLQASGSGPDDAAAEARARLLQMIGLCSSLLTSDAPQRAIKSLRSVLVQGAQPATAGSRRGRGGARSESQLRPHSGTAASSSTNPSLSSRTPTSAGLGFSHPAGELVPPTTTTPRGAKVDSRTRSISNSTTATGWSTMSKGHSFRTAHTSTTAGTSPIPSLPNWPTSGLEAPTSVPLQTAAAASAASGGPTPTPGNNLLPPSPAKPRKMSASTPTSRRPSMARAAAPSTSTSTPQPLGAGPGAGTVVLRPGVASGVPSTGPSPKIGPTRSPPPLRRPHLATTLQQSISHTLAHPGGQLTHPHSHSHLISHAHSLSHHLTHLPLPLPGRHQEAD